MIKKEIELKKWGNSQGFRLTQADLQELGADSSTHFYLTIENKQLVITPRQEEPQSLEELFQNYSGGELVTEEYDWGEPQGEEVW